MATLCLLLLVGCGAPPPAPAPTETSSATASPPSSATSTPPPSETPEPTATEQPTELLLTFAKDAYCRVGPGTAYHDTGSFRTGETALAEARSVTEPRWLWVQLVDGEHCWISDFTIEPDPAADFLPVQEDFPALPAPPTGLYLFRRDCTPGAIEIKLAWTQSPDADGYVAYFNGVEVFRPLERQHTFEHRPQPGESLYYELAAVNEVGYSERVGIGVEACP
jgi:hypothetical protein